MIREAGLANCANVGAFVLNHAERAKFPLANLRSHGFEDAGLAPERTHTMRVWQAREGLSGVVGLRQGGLLLPMIPKPGDPGAFAQALDGGDVTGTVGTAQKVREFLCALGLTARPSVLDKDEPSFTLDLALQLVSH